MLNIKVEAINNSTVLKVSTSCIACCDEVVCPEVYISLSATITVPGTEDTLTFSTSDDTFIETFDASEVNLEVFQAGIYQIDYVITHSGGTLNITKYYPVLCDIETTFGTILSNTRKYIGNPKYLDCLNYVCNAFMQKEALMDLVIEDEDDVADAQAILDYLQDVCNNKDCECYG